MTQIGQCRAIRPLGSSGRTWQHEFVEYEIEIKDDALAVLRKLPDDVRRQIGFRLHQMQQDLTGDVKKLQGSKNEYRLRVGNYRVLFELEGSRIAVYDVGQRKDIYQ